MAQIHPVDDVSAYHENEDEDEDNYAADYLDNNDIESVGESTNEADLDEKKPGFKKKFDPLELAKQSKEKEVQFLVSNVQNKLKDIFHMEMWEKRKACLLSFSFISGAMGVFLVLYGFGLTVLFQANPINYGIGAVGVVMLLPILAVVYYFLCPTKKQAAHRKKIKEKRNERRNDDFLNSMMMDAAKKAKPPDRKVRLIAVVRGSHLFARKEFPFVGTTVRNMLIDVEKATGLPMVQQIVKHGTVELTTNLDQHFVHDLHMPPDTVLLVFNKGKYEMNVIKKHDPKRAAKLELPEAPESWEDNLKKHWAKGTAMDEAINKNNNKSIFDLDDAATVGNATNAGDNASIDNASKSMKGGKSVITLGGGSAVVSTGAQQGSVAKTSISNSTLATGGKVSFNSTKKVAWSK